MEEFIRIPYEKLDPVMRAALVLKLEEEQKNLASEESGGPSEVDQPAGYTMTPIGESNGIVTIRVQPLKKEGMTLARIAKYFSVFGFSGILLSVGVTMSVAGEWRDVGIMLIFAAMVDFRCAVWVHHINLFKAHTFSLERDLQLTKKRLSLLEGDIYLQDGEMPGESDSAPPEKQDASHAPPKTVEASACWTDPKNNPKR